MEPASGSVAPSVATTVPAAAFSCTEPPATVMSVGASFWLVTAMVTVSVRRQAAGVGDGDVDLVRGGGLVVEGGAGLEADSLPTTSNLPDGSELSV